MMTKRLKVGDQVTASEDDPQYEIKRSKTEHIAMHKGQALRKTSA